MSLGKLPARWRRESAELERIAVQRDVENRTEAAGRILARADTMRACADELEQELTTDTDPPTVHNAPD